MPYCIYRWLFLFFIGFSLQSIAQQQSTFRLLDENSQTITIEFSLGDFTIYSDDSGQSLIFSPGSGNTMQKSAPELPYFAQSFIIPDIGIAALTDSVIVVEEQLIHQVHIAPSKGIFTRGQRPSEISRLQGPTYQQNQFFPGHLAKLNHPYIFRDFRGQTLQVYPFQYNPVSKTLRVCKRLVIEIKKQTHVPGPNIFLRQAYQAKPSKEFANIYKKHFINYNSTAYTPLSERGDMLIISHPAFIPLLHEFVQWKMQSGMHVELVSVTEAGGNNPNAIKDYIRNKYLSQGITFVVLVGDHPQIPSLTSLGGAADPKYGFIVGDDAYPEVIIGRISAELPIHVETQIRRFIDYEKATNMNYGFLSTCMQIASDEGPGDNGEYDHEHLQLIRQQLMNFTYNHAFEFYDGSQGGFDAPGNPTSGMVVNALNQGAGIINYTGHGWEEGWATSGFNNNDIAGLQNEGKLPFIWSVACVNGDFVGRTCFAEQWLRATRNGQAIGAIGAFMSSVNQYWSPPMAAQDEMVHLLTDPNPLTAKRTFGGLSVNGCMKMNDVYEQAGYDMTETWHLFGDPSLMVRTANPQTMTVEHPESIYINQTSLAVAVSVEHAFVCLYQDGTILAGSSVIDGMAYFSELNLQSPSPIKVTVTAFNHIPYQGEIQVLLGAHPFIVISDFSINDLSGNQNGLADYSEEITVQVTVSNIGSVHLSQIHGRLDSAIGNVDNLSTDVLIEYLPAGESVIINSAFRLRVHDLIDDQETAILTFRFTGQGEQEWLMQRSITLHAPLFEIQSLTFIHQSGSINNNPQPGETLFARYLVSNNGHSASSEGVFSISFNNPYISTHQNELAASPIPPGEVHEFEIEIEIDPMVPPGTNVNLLSQIYAHGYTAQSNHLLRIGIMLDNAETGDLSLWPWISESNPWFADQQFAFTGEYSFRSGIIGDSQSSVLSLNFYTPTADSVRFYRKVSSEEGYDFLKFYINDELTGQWSGQLDWQRFSYPVQPGSHQLRWEYVKDEIIALHLDAAWIDDIELPPLSTFQAMNTDKVEIHADALQIFPNPAKDLLHIRVGENATGILTIFSADGRVISQQNLSESQTSIGLNHLSAGIYIIRFEQPNGKIATARFILTQ